jgi:hypothetical protein
MNPLSPLCPPSLGNFHGIFRINGYPPEIALCQPYALAVFQVNRRYNNHASLQKKKSESPHHEIPKIKLPMLR